MNAQVITEHGPAARVFKRQQVNDPVPRPQDVVVRVEATSVNPVDCRIRQHSLVPRQFPLILGYDVCGTVVETGSAVTGLKTGDRIYGSPDTMRPGANAELVAMDARSCAPAPALSAAAAAVIPLAAITAWEALYERLALESGDTVLIHAGAGGVGHFAIQLAQAKGCRVITTASRPESIDFCRHRLGADWVIDYRQEDVSKRVLELTEGRGCTKIFDTIGGDTFYQSVGCTAVNGAICTILPVRTDPVSHQLLLRNLTVHYEFMGASLSFGTQPEKQGRVLQQLTRLVEAGTLSPHLAACYSWDDLAQAHEAVETARTIGKIAVVVE